MSFPSDHSSNAFSSATLSNRNLNAIKMPAGVRLPLQVGNIVIATGVAWARVEAGAHYPSDVLAGAAIGHFISAFMYDAFMGLPEQKNWVLYASPTKGGAMVEVSFDF
jgi:membrane-associated phospholipid phosphatase